MNTLVQMTIATSLFVMAQYVQAHPVDDVDNMTAAQIEMLTQDCLSDYVLDWHDKRCDFLRPEGDADNSYNEAKRFIPSTRDLAAEAAGY